MSTQINLGLILAGQNIPSLESIPCLGDFSNPMTPKPSPRHVFPAWAGRAPPAWWSMPPSLGGGLYVCGPSGCGKSSSIREWCARTGTPLYQVTANGRLEFPDLVGHVSLESDGSGGTKTSFVHGPLSLAMKNGGVFLLDEIDLLDPAVCAGLNGVLDGSGLLIPENGGEYIQPHELFRFAATGNSKGRGDDTGAYAGVAVQNAALLDRFTCVEATWLPRSAEQVVVGSVPGAPQGDALKKLFDFADSVRAAQARDGAMGIQKPLTTRSLLRFAAYMAAYAKLPPARLNGMAPAQAAMLDAWAGGLSEADQVSVSELWQAVFGAPLVPPQNAGAQPSGEGGSHD